MSKQRVVSNLIVMGTGQIATWVISLAYSVVISRYLGPTRLGEFMLATSIVAVLGLVVGLGMNTLLTRTVARTPDRTSALASAAIVARVLLGIPALAALYAYARIAHLNAETRTAAFILAASMIVGSLGNVLLAVFQGHERMELNTIWTVAQNVLLLAAAVLVRWLHGGVVAFAAIQVLIALTLLALNLRWMSRFARLTWRVSWQDLREVMAGGLAFWASNVFLTIYLYIDSVMLAALAGNGAVGIYTPAVRLFSVALFLPNIVGPVTLPLLSRLGVTAGSDYTRVARKTLSLLIACAMPLTVGLAVAARPLMVAIFGSAYLLSAPVLVVLSLSILPTFLSVQFYQILTARDQQWRWTAVMATSCVVNPLLNAVLIPLAERHWHDGALGASLALLSTEVLMALYGMVTLRDLLWQRAIGRVAAGTLVAGAAQAAVLWLAGPVWIPLAEALAAAAYGVVAVALDAVPRDDVAFLLAMAAQRLQRPRVRVAG